MVQASVGNWSPYEELTDETQHVFADGIEGLMGVDYKPLAVAHQVVAGMNYSFFCNAQVTYPGAPSYPAIVNMYRNLDGHVAITHIQRISQI